METMKTEHTTGSWVKHIIKDGGDWTYQVRTLKPHGARQDGIGSHLATVNKYLRDVDEVVAPALVCGGEHELEPTRNDIDQLVSSLQSAKKEVVAGAGHMLPMEKTAEFAAVVTRFLGELQ